MKYATPALMQLDDGWLEAEVLESRTCSVLRARQDKSQQVFMRISSVSVFFPFPALCFHNKSWRKKLVKKKRKTAKSSKCTKQYAAASLIFSLLIALRHLLSLIRISRPAVLLFPFSALSEVLDVGGVQAH